MARGPRPSEIHAEVGRRLATRGVRYTSGRRTVIGALQRVSGPQSAADLHKRIRSVPLSSLYRSLTVLDESGIVRRHHDAVGLARFELAEWLTGHHHHVVCIDCGTVEDVELDAATETVLDTVAASVAGSAGYELGGHVLEVEGVCSSCRV